MKTTTVHFGTRTFVIVSLLALPAGSLACGAAPGGVDDGNDRSEKASLATPDSDAAAPDEEPTGTLVDPTQPAPRAPAAHLGPRQK